MVKDPRWPIRRTMSITEKANNNLKQVSKTLNVNQFDMISYLLETVNADDPELIKWAEDRAKVTKEEKEQLKEIQKRMARMTPEQIQTLLNKTQ